LIFKPHSDKQELALTSDKKIVLVSTGIQWGKTMTGAMRLKVAMHQFRSPDDTFILTAPSYKIMKQSSLPAFLKVMQGVGEYNKNDAEFKMFGGGTCYMRTMTEPDSIVGITNVRAIWCDEAGKYSLYAWENIQNRASFKQAPIWITTTPYSLNWVYKELVRQKDKRDDLVVIQATSKENPYFPAAEYDRKEKEMAPVRFRQTYGGAWEKMAGLVYDCFSDIENICEPMQLPVGTRVFGGIDWGHTHPFVLLVRAVTPDGYHFQVAEFYKVGMTINDIVNIARQLRNVWDIERFYCGPDRPENIQELNRAGLTAVAANNDVKFGVDKHYELIKTRRYQIFRDTSPHTLDEMETYHWPAIEDVEPDKNTKDPNPVKQDDDCMDCNRYISASIFHLAGTKRPAKFQREARTQSEVPKSNSPHRFKRRSHVKNYEEWQ
jgi:PBSX family phage terminase large subunit